MTLPGIEPSLTTLLARAQPNFTCEPVGANQFWVNAALLASQWQHRAWIVSLQHPVSVEQGAEQVASTVFEVFGMTRPGIEPVSTLMGDARICRLPFNIKNSNVWILGFLEKSIKFDFLEIIW